MRNVKKCKKKRANNVKKSFTSVFVLLHISVCDEQFTGPHTTAPLAMYTAQDRKASGK